MTVAAPPRQTPMPARAVLVARHTAAVKDWDPEEGCEVIVGYLTGWRVTCRRHGQCEDFDTEAAAQCWARCPSGFCTACADEWMGWERENPPPFPDDCDGGTRAVDARHERGLR